LIWCQQKRTADNCGTSGTEGFQRFVRARFAQQTGGERPHPKYKKYKKTHTDGE
jgi:hypothetical protein